MNKLDLVGKKFNRLTILSEYEKRGKHVRYIAVCICGTFRIVYSTNLMRNYTVSCGCHDSEKKFRHGMSYSKEYKIWTVMLQRCTNSKCKAYKDYGGRGIEVCPEWLIFETLEATGFSLIIIKLKP